MKRENRIGSGLISNMALSGICKPASMIMGYIYVPIVLSFLGTEKYGIWSTLLTILSWISYFDIGIGNGLRNKLAESITAGDVKKSQCLISSAYVFITFIITWVTIIFCIIAAQMDWNKVFGTPAISENIKAIVLLSIIFISINFVLSICKNILYACQKAATVSYMEIMTQFLNLAGVLLAKRFVSGNLFIIALIYGSSMTITNVVFSIALFVKKKELFPRLHCVNPATGKSLTNLGIQFFVLQIAALVLFTTDSVMISSLYGAANVTPYSTVNKLFNAISSIYLAFLVPVWSAATKAKAEKEWIYLHKMVHRLRLFMLPFFSGIIILAAVFKPLAMLWLGQELYYEPGLILWGGVYCALTIWCNTYANIVNGLELMRLSMGVAVIQAIVNIPLSIMFAVPLGMKTAGILLGTVLSMSIAGIALPIAVSVFLKKQKKLEK